MPATSDRTPAGRLRERVAALIGVAGYGVDDPLVVGVQRDNASPVFLVGGRTLAGESLTADAIVYTASLSKQITAACAALLVQEGRLDIESSLAQWMPELPAWADAVRLRHLISHTSGLPEGVEFDDLHRARLDRTTDGVIGALVRVDHLDSAAGTEFRYCNAGYLCLAVIVGRAAGRPLADFAREHVFVPLGMVDSRYWSGPASHPPGAVPLDSHCPAPLSLGDGGVWSTAADILRWNQALERDELGVSAILQAPGRLDDGTWLDYAWGLDVREHVGRRIYRHGGRWAGVSAQLVRLADQGSSFVIIALDDDEDRTAALANAMIEELITSGWSRIPD
jgi:CubicO group peptidase (beta-lactamase class C family)